jgi:hypothetical protein
MSKQDRNGVRTPQDLERKYNFAGLVKAVRLHDNEITKTDKTLEDFIYATVGSLKNHEGTKDGNITTYYSSGVPTTESYPADCWTEAEYENHIDDLYYDKDTGYTYAFTVKDDGVYGWERTNAKYIIQALAMANSSYDTADGQRRVFTSKPTPPYENGDMWVNSGNVYICQISKAETETYQENDFIIAKKYAGNTLSEKVGNILKVLQGVVLEIRNSVDEYNVKLDNLDTGIASHMIFDEDNGLQIGNKVNGFWRGLRAQIKGEAFSILNEPGKKVASFGESLIELCGGKGQIEYKTETGEISGKTREYLQIKGKNVRLKADEVAGLYVSRFNEETNMLYETDVDVKDGEVEIFSRMCIANDDGTQAGKQEYSYIRIGAGGVSLESSFAISLNGMFGGVKVNELSRSDGEKYMTESEVIALIESHGAVG